MNLTDQQVIDLSVALENTSRKINECAPMSEFEIVAFRKMFRGAAQSYRDESRAVAMLVVDAVVKTLDLAPVTTLDGGAP